MLRLVALLACALAVASAQLDLADLSSSIYPATQARAATPWTHAAVGKPAQALRLAVVLPSLEKNSGTEQMLFKLTQRGHSVDVFVTSTVEDTFVFRMHAVKAAAPSNKGSVYAESTAVYEALTSLPHFDVVVFQGASGLVSLQAKKAGLAFASTQLAVAMGMPTKKLTTLRDTVGSFMERESVRLADVAFTFQAEVPAALASAGFKLPASLYQVAPKAIVSFVEFVASELSAVEASREEPLVSVVVTTFNRGAFLRECVASLESQTYSNLQLVIVDDGSTDAEAAEALRVLERHEHVVVVRQENQYLGAARNAGVAAATGDLVLFMDDDNIAFPSMVATLVRALAVSGADVAVNAHSVWMDGEPRTSAKVWTPLGPAPLAGLLENVLGNANFMIRKSAFSRLGGFTTDRTGQEDYEFHAAAVLAHTPYVVVPRSLMFYRMHNREEQMFFETAGVEAEERALRPYTSLLQQTGHSTRDVLEHKRVSASSCTISTVSAESCSAAPVYTIVVDAVVYTDAGYADAGPEYSAVVEMGPAGTVPLTTFAHTQTLAGTPSGSQLTLTGPGPAPGAGAGAVLPSLDVSVTLNVGLTNGYALPLEITCVKTTKAAFTQPPCRCASATSAATISDICTCTDTCLAYDFNADGLFNLSDLATLLAGWGDLGVSPNPVSDPTGLGAIGINQLANLLLRWRAQIEGRIPTPADFIPA